MEQRTETTAGNLRGRLARWFERNAYAFMSAGDAVACLNGYGIPAEVREAVIAERNKTTNAPVPAPAVGETTVVMTVATA